MKTCDISRSFSRTRRGTDVSWAAGGGRGRSENPGGGGRGDGRDDEWLGLDSSASRSAMLSGCFWARVVGFGWEIRL